MAFLTQLYHSLGTRKKTEWEGTRIRDPGAPSSVEGEGDSRTPLSVRAENVSYRDLQKVHSKTLECGHSHLLLQLPSLLLTGGVVPPWRPSGPQLVETHPAFSQGALRNCNSSLCPHKGPLCHSLPENNAPPSLPRLFPPPHMCLLEQQILSRVNVRYCLPTACWNKGCA